MDLSKHTSLAGIAEAVEIIRTAAAALGCPIFVTGAMARDLWLTFGYGIDTGRRTEDLDFAVQCEDWDTFDRLATRLTELGVQRDSNIPHKFTHPNGTEMDLLPFGGVERPDRTIAWPPRQNQVMNLLGFSELAGETTEMFLPGKVPIPVVSQPALALLKLIAWEDRRAQGTRKDAVDLYIIGRTYLESRVPAPSIEQKSGLLERNEFEDRNAGAELLGLDMAPLGTPDLEGTIISILDREADQDGPLRLASDMKRGASIYEFDDAISFLAALRTGYLGLST